MGAKKQSSVKSDRKASKKRSKEKDGSLREKAPDFGAVNSVKSCDLMEEIAPKSQSVVKEHKKQLQRLQEKDPEFYQFLKEHDKELLDFNDEDIDEDAETDLYDEDEPLHEEIGEDELQDEDLGEDVEASFDDVEPKNISKEKLHEPRKIVTTEMVDGWCKDIKENKKIGAIRSLLRAFRIACHYGDDGGFESNQEFKIVSSNVFNKIMVFVLNEMDGVLRGLLKFPKSGGKKESVLELTSTKAWKNYGSLMKLYLGNALHVLNQMTDEQMASFTLKRIKSSGVFLAAFPALLRKYVKVALHFWGNGGGALQVVSFLFLRELCVRLDSDCLDACLKGIYKAYVSNSKVKGKYASGSKLQHLRFLANCVTEIYGVDLPSAYQHAFVCIRQLAMILRNALSEKPKKKEEDGGKKKEEKGKKKTEEDRTKKKKEAYLKVYDWQFINCLELWTSVVSAYSLDVNFQHLAYPLTQIIIGVARLVPTARYLPIRMQCARMLNRIGASTGNFIPVSLLLLDVLEMKELTDSPTGGVGKAIDLFTRKLVGKPSLKTRAFQEACIYSVVELLAEHLAQWSYSIAFFELSFIPLVRLRNFCKSSKIIMFQKEIKELIHQVEANSEFTNEKRASFTLTPSDPSVAFFLKAEKESGSSPLSQFAASLQLRAQQRSNSLVKSSVLVGEKSSIFGKKPSSDSEDDDSDGGSEEGADVFSSSWLPDSKSGLAKSERPKKKKQQQQPQRDRELQVAMDEDVVEDLVLSSDDDEPASSISASEEEADAAKGTSFEGESKKRKHRPASSKKNWRPSAKRSKNKKKPNAG